MLFSKEEMGANMLCFVLTGELFDNANKVHLKIIIITYNMSEVSLFLGPCLLQT